MLYILVLLLIPVFFVGIIIYTCTLFDYIQKDTLDMMLLLIGLFATLISSFFTLKEMSLIETKSYIFTKFQKRVDSIISILSYSLVMLFGVSLIANSIKHTLSYPRLFIGIAIIIFYLYIIYILFIQRKEYVCTIKDITKVSDKLYIIFLANKELGVNEFYVKDKKKLKKDTQHKVYYNKTSKSIIRIFDEEIEG